MGRLNSKLDVDKEGTSDVENRSEEIAQHAANEIMR